MSVSYVEVLLVLEVADDRRGEVVGVVGAECRRWPRGPRRRPARGCPSRGRSAGRSRAASSAPGSPCRRRAAGSWSARPRRRLDRDQGDGPCTPSRVRSRSRAGEEADLAERPLGDGLSTVVGRRRGDDVRAAPGSGSTEKMNGSRPGRRGHVARARRGARSPACRPDGVARSDEPRSLNQTTSYVARAPQHVDADVAGLEPDPEDRIVGRDPAAAHDRRLAPNSGARAGPVPLCGRNRLSAARPLDDLGAQVGPAPGQRRRTAATFVRSSAPMTATAMNIVPPRRYRPEIVARVADAPAQPVGLLLERVGADEQEQRGQREQRPGTRAGR